MIWAMQYSHYKCIEVETSNFKPLIADWQLFTELSYVPELYRYKNQFVIAIPPFRARKMPIFTFTKSQFVYFLISWNFNWASEKTHSQFKTDNSSSQKWSYCNITLLKNRRRLYCCNYLCHFRISWEPA